MRTVNLVVAGQSRSNYWHLEDVLSELYRDKYIFKTIAIEGVKFSIILDTFMDDV